MDWKDLYGVDRGQSSYTTATPIGVSDLSGDKTFNTFMLTPTMTPEGQTPIPTDVSVDVVSSTTPNPLLLTPTVTPTAVLPDITPTSVTTTTTPTDIPDSTQTVVPTVTPTVVPTVVPTPTATQTVVPTPTATPTMVPTPTATPTVVPTPTATPTVAPTATATPTATPTVAPTATATSTATPTVVPTPTATPTVAPTATVTPTVDPSATPTPDIIPPSGYSATISQGLVNSSNVNAVSVDYTGAEIGATYYAIFDDSNGTTTPVTATGTVSNSTGIIIGVDISSLDDGNISLRFYLKDSAGNQGADVNDTVFMDKTLPTVSNVSPASGSVDVHRSTNIVITFSESIDIANPGTISLGSPSMTFIHNSNCTISYSSAVFTNDTITVDPELYFDANTVHSNLSITGYKDINGNPMTSFTEGSSYTMTTKVAAWYQVGPDVAANAHDEGLADVYFTDDNTMYVSYAETDRIIVKKYSGGSWIQVGSSIMLGSGSDYFRMTRLVHDGAYLMLGYAEYNSTLDEYYPHVAYYDGVTWTIILDDVVSGDNYSDTGLFGFSERDGKVHTMIHTGSVLQSRKFNSAWTDWNSPVDTNAGYALAMDTASDGTLYASYVDSVTGEVYVKQSNGGAWTVTGGGPVVSSINGIYYHTDITVMGDTVYVTYPNNFKMPVSRSVNGGAWEDLGDLQPFFTYAYITFDKKGNIFATHDDNAKMMEVFTYDGAGWTLVPGSNSLASSAIATNVNITVDNNNVIYLIFYESPSYIHVYKYE